MFQPKAVKHMVSSSISVFSNKNKSFQLTTLRPLYMAVVILLLLLSELIEWQPVTSLDIFHFFLTLLSFSRLGMTFRGKHSSKSYFIIIHLLSIESSVRWNIDFKLLRALLASMSFK